MFVGFVIFSLIAVGFCTYQSYKAWGGGRAAGVFVGGTVLSFLPYVGPPIVIIGSIYLYNSASSRVMDDALDATTPAETSTAPHADPSSLDRLERLNRLRDSGGLTDEEFDAKKEEIIDTV